MDVRQGLLGRQDALELASKIDQMEPAVLKYFLDITGYTKDQFYSILHDQRRPEAIGKEIPVTQIEDNNQSIIPYVIDFITTTRKKHRTNDTRDS
jgi:hypothetical protein